MTSRLLCLLSWSLVAALGGGCASLEAPQDNRSLTLEIPLQADTSFRRTGGEDGRVDHGIELQDQWLTLRQGEQTLLFDLRQFPGELLVVHGTGLIPPVLLRLPGDVRLLWEGRRLKVGDDLVRVPRRGRFRYDRDDHRLLAMDDEG